MGTNPFLLGRSRRGLVCRIAGVIVAIYAIVGFAAVPMIAQSKLPEILSDALDAEVRIRDMDFNPFTLRAAAEGFSVTSEKQGPLFFAEEMAVDLQLASVIRKGGVVKSIEIRKPEIRVLRRPDGSFSLMDLAGGKPASGEEKQARMPEGKKGSAWPVYFEVGTLQITGGRVLFSDEASGFDTVIDPLSLEVENMSSKAGSLADVALSLATRSGARMACTGQLGLFPLSAKMHLELGDLPIAQFAPYYREHTGLEIAGGRLDLSANVVFPQAKPPEKNPLVRNGKIRIRSLRLKDPANGSTAIDIAEFAVSAIRIDPEGRTIDAQSVTSREGRILCERAKDGKINLSKIVAGNSAQDPEAGTDFTPAPRSGRRDTEPGPGKPGPPDPAWNIRLGLFSLSRYSVAYTDAVPKKPVSMGLDDITIRLYDLAVKQEHATRWSFASLARPGIVSAQGTFGLDPAAADFEFRISEMDLADAAPYAAPFGISIQKGRIHASGAVNARVTGDGLRLRYEGEAGITGFSAAGLKEGKEFLSFARLGLEGIRLELADTPSLLVDRMLVDAPRLTVGIREDGSLSPGPFSSSSPLPPAGGEKRQSRPTAPKTAFEPAVNRIEVKNGSLVFADHSVTPLFTARLEPIEAEVSGFRLGPENTTRFVAKGRLDGQAPFSVAGETQPMAPADRTEAKVGFKNISMPMFTPYSGKYLGYEIQKGKLFMDLGYEVDSRKLDGQNRLRLDQFYLGRTVQSPQAISLPLKLALALLRDRSGKIELDVPVQGDMANPKFRLGRVIFTAFINLLKKLATSPFSALAALIPGAEELGFVDFQPGLADLDNAAKEKLAGLAAALYQRPGLRLLIRPGADPVRDRQALKNQRMEELVRAEKARAENSKKAGPEPQKTYVRYLESACKTAGIRPKDDASVAELEEALKKTIEIPDSRLIRLAARRGDAIRNTLLADERIEADRVFLENPRIGDLPRAAFELEAK